MTNLTGSTTSTSIVISHLKTISFHTNNDIVLTPATPKRHHTTKYNVTSISTKNQINEKLQIEDKKDSYSYDMEAVEFLNHINFENIDFDDDEIDYVEESI